MRYLRNCWYPAAWAEEVGSEPLARAYLDEPVVLFRNGDGRGVALEDRCCHKYLPLSMGRVKGGAIECGYHGMTFDGEGACVRIPGQASIPGNARVRAYPTAEHLGMVWIWPGEPERADEALLFPLPAYGRSGWTANKGPYTYIRANYRHLTDNLLDPMHVSFVHPTTLGSPEMADIPVETEQQGDHVAVTRWTEDRPPVAIFRKFANFDGNVDRWQIYNFHPPSISVTDFGSGPVGMDRSDAGRDAAMRIYSCHFITPETERSSHYLWMQVRNFAPDDEQVSATMTEQFILAFDEDREILEAVQRSEDEATRPPVKLAIDNGPNRSRRIIERLIREENTQAAAE